MIVNLFSTILVQGNLIGISSTLISAKWWILRKFLNMSCLDFIWCQEEHRNAGAWSFVGPRFQNIVGVKVFTVHLIVYTSSFILVICIFVFVNSQYILHLNRSGFVCRQFTTRVDGPSWRVTGFHYPSPLAELTGRLQAWAVYTRRPSKRNGNRSPVNSGRQLG